MLRPWEEAKKANKEIIDKLMEDFREQWEPAVDKLDKAAKAFEAGLTWILHLCQLDSSN